MAVAFEQSPFLRVIPEERVRETLQLMQLPADARVTRELARDVARREQAKAFVAASIGPLGANYVISLEAVDATTGDVRAREQVEAAGKEEVLTALGAAVSRLRARLGESLALVERFDVPLARATTPSLEALRAYSQALDGGRLNPRAEAIPPLLRAIELDPNFAMAHALLSGVYANTGRFADAPAHAMRAYELRDRVSERERFFIAWRYYLDAEQAWDKALALAESWTATYPREAFAFNSLALASSATGNRGRALEALREAIRLDPKFVPPHRNLVGNLIAVNRFDDASAALDDVLGLGIDVTGTRFASFVLSRLGARSAPPIPDPDWSPTWEARAAAAAGRFADARASYARAIAHAASRDLRDLAAQWSMETAELQALAGDCQTARDRIADGLQFGRDNFTLERASRALGLCGDVDGVRELTTELARRYPAATLTHRLQIPLAQAILRLERGDPAAALEQIGPVRPLAHAPSAEFWPKYIRAQALLKQGESRAAIAQFEEITNHRGEAPLSPLYALAHLGLSRAHDALGDAAAAQETARRFRALWAGADERVVVHFSAPRP
jgi:tetratricopeptide (TPR) repeat protein